MFINTLLIIAVCASSTLVYALLFIIGVRPWWSPQYSIPILGEMSYLAAKGGGVLRVRAGGRGVQKRVHVAMYERGAGSRPTLVQVFLSGRKDKCRVRPGGARSTPYPYWVSQSSHPLTELRAEPNSWLTPGQAL
jgi:hypothetical protein